MQINQEFQCTIEKIAMGGDGLTRVDNEVIFIAGTLPGEKLIARSESAKKNFSRAKIVRFGETSPHRIEPVCKYYGRCPGCRYLHSDYAYESQIKRDQMLDSFASARFELGNAEFSVYAPAGPLHYRNKIVFHVHVVGNEKFFGYVNSDNVTVVDIDYCHLAHPAINEAVDKMRRDRSFMASLREGMDVTFRYTESDGVKIWRNNPEKNASWLKETVSFGTLSVPCGSFFQVNRDGCDRLLAQVAAAVGELKIDTLIDLYAGSGLFAALGASLGIRNILAVESDEAAAAAAKYNLKQYGIAEPQVIAGDAAEAFDHPMFAAGTNPLLVVDPPRCGLSQKAGTQIIKSPLRHLAYISCNPASWLRDAAKLQKGGFVLRKLELVNMFPRTEHFELSSLWTR